MDSAAPGTNARSIAVDRQLKAELARIRGRPYAQLLWDVKGFYDSIRLVPTIEATEKLDFPRDLLYLCGVMHVAPRTLRSQNCYAEPLKMIGISILMGCTSSTRISRAILRRPLVRASSFGQEALAEDYSCGAHVDDVTQAGEAQTEEAVPLS